MTTTHDRPSLGRPRRLDRAFFLLRSAFTLAPILFQLDKFAEVLTDDWEAYLAPWVNDIVFGTASDGG